ncbi:MAG: molybdenum cofactor biosynthesis protein MoaE [Planctomycetaceae bacterium]|nr:molybdenum cofactor biosynthesis protein MoaE [Planctomycetaceae bacterium]MBT6056369.1 molybdenum cofactor biosynthesis protein MoaE [Planctomycetaceae bacterium]MBT6459586.1 molybdenum cofactor biosynthesis protein MoaE [Planctomycetaceae bacterium]MBT6641978.1 molybdenum cofactor biosynthesis protein MoaE [Planctomycetaceae bacterium]MBT6918582.1 molybdenum cofactor biosynthesis protein MoaE [Planctomycetaceae bacterium]
MFQFSLTDDPIDTSLVLSTVVSASAGANVLFTGTTRQETEGVITNWLEYDAYKPLAERECVRLYEQAVRKFRIIKCSIVHRLGKVSVGEVSIAVAVSAVHRAEAFASASWLLDRIKEDVPVWKRQVGDAQTFWVHPEQEENTSRDSNGVPQESDNDMP